MLFKMRLQNQLTTLALSTLSLLPVANAVFADEAYSIDYHHQLIGIPQSETTFFHKPSKNEKASLLYTLSDLGVLGAVNPGSGEVVWRQLLGDDGQGFLRAAEGEGWIVSAVGESVKAWDALSGRIKWDAESVGSVRDLEIMETVGDDKAKDVLALYEKGEKGVLRRLSGKDGELIWEYTDASADVPFQVSTNVRNVFVISLHGARGGYNIKVTTLDPVSGKKLDDTILASKSDVHGPEDVMFVGANSAMPVVAWTDKSLKTLNVNILGTSKVQTLTLTSAGEAVEKIILHAPHLVQSQTHFLVHSQSAVSHWAEVFHINLSTGAVTKAYDLPKVDGMGSFSTSSQDANVYFTRETEKEVVVVSSKAQAPLGTWAIQDPSNSSYILHGVSEVVSRSANSYAVRSAVVTSEDDWVMIRNGAPAWTRAEGLSGVVAAEWAEFPEEVNLAQTLEAEAHSSPLAAYIHRLKRHLNDLQYLPSFLQSVPERVISSFLPIDINATQSSGLTKDVFGFRKLVLVATQRGRILGLNAGDHGRVIWSKKAAEIPAGEKWDVKGIYVDNLAGYATIKDSVGRTIVVKTIDGLIEESAKEPTEVYNTVLVDSVIGPNLISIGAGGTLPSKIPIESAPKDQVVVLGENGEVNGYAFLNKGEYTVPTTIWTFTPPSGQKVIGITARPAHDPIASIGRVLGDRSVLYKYLNPNVVLVTTVSGATETATFYLLDSVSGEILYSTTHEGVDVNKPITSLLTENWFVFSLWSDLSADASGASSYKGYQLVITELYESDIPNDRGPLGESQNFSSLHPSTSAESASTLPYVITQTFLVPEAISGMAVTSTRQGITSRQLLCTIESSNAIISIPRNVIEARRPVGRDPVPAEMEEGLTRYQPVIDFPPQGTLTHKREVLGIKKIITSPSLLESTSLVFAYGIDVFGTRVAPSLAFDILGKGFSKGNMLLTVAALAAGVTFLAPVVKKKQINARWMTS